MIHKLDAMVAERVMGWRVHSRATAWWVDAEHETGLVPSGGVRGFVGEWSPSTDISCAWEVVEKIHDRSHKIEVTFDPDRGVCKTWKSKGKSYTGTPDINPNPKPHYVCSIMLKSEKYPQCWSGGVSVKEDTAPLAICLAALRAVGVSKAEIEEAMR